MIERDTERWRNDWKRAEQGETQNGGMIERKRLREREIQRVELCGERGRDRERSCAHS